MSLKDKFSELKFDNQLEPVVEKKTAVDEDWGRLLCLIEPVYPELHQFLLWVAEHGVSLKNAGNLEKDILLDGSILAGLPAINIQINPEKGWTNGDVLL
jgi:hypothetical protein